MGQSREQPMAPVALATLPAARAPHFTPSLYHGGGIFARRFGGGFTYLEGSGLID